MDYLTLRLKINTFLKHFVKGEFFLKTQNLSKQGVKTGVAMATSDTLQAKVF